MKKKPVKKIATNSVKAKKKSPSVTGLILGPALKNMNKRRGGRPGRIS